MSTIEKLPVNHRYATIRTETTGNDDAHWLYMHADAASGIRPCCRKDMLDEMWNFMSAITRPPAERNSGKLRHFVLASDANAYNLGGDLDLFTRLIREGNASSFVLLRGKPTEPPSFKRDLDPATTRTRFRAANVRAG